MPDDNYKDAIAGLEQIRHQLDDLIGAYGVRRGQAGWFIVVRARDELLRLAGDFERHERIQERTR